MCSGAPQTPQEFSKLNPTCYERAGQGVLRSSLIDWMRGGRVGGEQEGARDSAVRATPRKFT